MVENQQKRTTENDNLIIRSQSKPHKLSMGHQYKVIVGREKREEQTLLEGSVGEGRGVEGNVFSSTEISSSLKSHTSAKVNTAYLRKSELT